jgi:hypothetical protein
MAYLNTNSFYSSFAHKTKGSGSVPKGKSAVGVIQPGTTGTNGLPKPPAPAPVSGGPAGAPGAPAGFTVATSTLPPDPTYDMQIGTFGKTRDDTIAGLVQQRGAGLQAYGYTEDPTTHAIAFDPNNPYSQAALLRKHYQQAKTGNTTSYAASGQLYAGSLQNAQNASTDQFNAGDNAIKQAVINFLANNTTAQKTAGDTYDYNAGLAAGDRVGRVPDNPLYAPVAGANAGGAIVSTDANGNVAVTGGPGGSALVPQQPYSQVKLASGWSIVYGPDGKPAYSIDPQGVKHGG